MCKRKFHRIGINFLVVQHGVFYVFNQPVSMFIHLLQMELPYLSCIEFTGFQPLQRQLMCIANAILIIFTHDGIKRVVPYVSSSLTARAYHRQSRQQILR